MLEKLILHDFHKKFGAKFVDFSGYEMPVNYSKGIMWEHLHTRSHAGLFDISHMGQIRVIPISGNTEASDMAIEKIFPIDSKKLSLGRQVYTVLMNSAGGVIDDIMISRKDGYFSIVSNAARKNVVLKYLKALTVNDFVIELEKDKSLFAIQGPNSEKIMADFSKKFLTLKFLDTASIEIQGMKLEVSRSGYSGEDGFEISVKNSEAVNFASLILKANAVELVGLGARDSLRLEAGLCLYGNELNETMTPIESGIHWVISKTRKQEGKRPGGFLGSDKILKQLDSFSEEIITGITPNGKAPMRKGTLLFSAEEKKQIGVVTSGGFSPSLKYPISIGLISKDFASSGTEIFADVRGNKLLATTTKLPFIKPNFKR